MIGVVRHLENYGAIKHRLHLHAAAHVFRPQFEVAAPFGLPIRCQVQEHVDPAMRLQLVVPVKVRMDLQELIASRHHGAATDEIGIREKTIDAGQSLEKEKKLTADNRVRIYPHRQRKSRNILDEFTYDVTIGMRLPAHGGIV